MSQHLRMIAQRRGGWNLYSDLRACNIAAPAAHSSAAYISSPGGRDRGPPGRLRDSRMEGRAPSRPRNATHLPSDTSTTAATRDRGPPGRLRIRFPQLEGRAPSRPRNAETCPHEVQFWEKTLILFERVSRRTRESKAPTSPLFLTLHTRGCYSNSSSCRAKAFPAGGDSIPPAHRRRLPVTA